MMLACISEAKKRKLRMSLFLIGKDITDVPTISKQSFVFNPFYSEERVDVLYH